MFVLLEKVHGQDPLHIDQPQQPLTSRRGALIDPFGVQPKSLHPLSLLDMGDGRSFFLPAADDGFDELLREFD